MSSSTTLLSRLPAILSAIAALAVLVLATLGLRSWLAAHDATTQLAATLAAQKQLLSEAAAREQQRDAALATTLASVARAKSTVRTPASSRRANSRRSAFASRPRFAQHPRADRRSTHATRGSQHPPGRHQAHLRRPRRLPRLPGPTLRRPRRILADERSKVTALTTERRCRHESRPKWQVLVSSAPRRQVVRHRSRHRRRRDCLSASLAARPVSARHNIPQMPQNPPTRQAKIRNDLTRTIYGTIMSIMFRFLGVGIFYVASNTYCAVALGRRWPNARMTVWLR